MSLRTNGIQIVDGSGKPFKLIGTFMGINERVYGLNSVPTNWTNAGTPENSWFNESDYQRLKSAGANCIELQCFRIGDFMPNGLVDLTNGVTSTFCATWTDKYALWSANNQIYSIIDIAGLGWWGVPNPDWAVPQFPPWLWTNANPPYPAPVTQNDYETIRKDWFNTTLPRQEANRQNFIALWAFLANRYKNNPYIIFSPMNEPGVSGSDASNNVYGIGYSNIMTQVFDAIRNAGANQLVLINRPYIYSPSLALYPVNRDIVWEDHTYMGDSHSASINNWKQSIDNMVQMYNVNFGKPFFIGEYGIDPPSDVRNLFPTTWQQIFTDMVTKIDSSPAVGRLWYSHGQLAWKPAPWNPQEIAYEEITHPVGSAGASDYAWYTFEETDWIKKLVLSTQTTMNLPFHDDFANLQNWKIVNGTWNNI